MRTISTILTCFLVLALLPVKAQDSLVVIPASYAVSYDKPIRIDANTLVRFESDSIFLVNSGRYTFYEELRMTLDHTDLGCENVINMYKNSLDENARITEKLLENSRKTSALNKQLFEEAQQSIDAAQESLKLTQQSLETANEGLDAANKQIRKMNKRSTRDKILIGLASAGVGLLIGIMAN